jgi:uncharacterized 2Fe-2S/4Fe-4S cluster protein (DUF4445 family)
MNSFTEINERQDVIRDKNSKAILKVDINAKNAWNKRKERNNQINTHENDINNIKKEIGIIKNMITELTNILEVDK